MLQYLTTDSFNLWLILKMVGWGLWKRSSLFELGLPPSPSFCLLCDFILSFNIILFVDHAIDLAKKETWMISIYIYIYLVAILFEVKTYCTLCKDASIFLKKGKRINSHGIGFYVNIWNIILLVWYIYTVQYLTFIIILIPTSKIKQRS